MVLFRNLFEILDGGPSKSLTCTYTNVQELRSVLKKTHSQKYQQEAHGPHRSPEKLVQISEYT